MTAHLRDIRVRYAETDQMGVAHHAAYVVWLEECRIELMRARGADYREQERQGVLMPVVELSIRYRRPLRFDDVANCATTVEVKGPSRLAFRTVVSLGATVCAEAEVTVAATSADGRPVRIPELVLERIRAAAH